LEEKNNPMPQVPEMPLGTPVVPVTSEPIVEVPKAVVPKEEPPVKMSWKKPIVKILIIGIVAVVIFLIIKG
jgi:hypothetical protein